MSHVKYENGVVTMNIDGRKLTLKNISEVRLAIDKIKHYSEETDFERKTAVADLLQSALDAMIKEKELKILGDLHEKEYHCRSINSGQTL